MPTKFTLALKDIVLEALHERGGVAYLKGIKDELFIALLIKCLPLTVEREASPPSTEAEIDTVLEDDEAYCAPGYPREFGAADLPALPMGAAPPADSASPDGPAPGPTPQG